MKLIHLANFNSTNIGNGALISGLEHVLKADIPGIEILQEPWDNYTFGIKKFDESFVEMVNKSDGLIVGAAVTLNGQKYQVHTGTRVELPLPLWKKIKKPVIFYGISHRHWPCQKYYNLKPFRETMRYVLNAPNILFSVRNDGTKEWIEEMLGYASKKILVVPDPAVFLETRDSFHPEIEPGKKNIILALNNEDEVYRFGGPMRNLFWKIFASFVSEKLLLKLWKKLPGWDSKKKRFLKRLASGLERLSKEKDINVILAPHYFDDYKAIAEFIPLCPLRFPHQVLVSTGMARVPQTGYFYDLYAKADLALSMRVHSMSPSIGVGTPMIALLSQSRLELFLKDVGLSDSGINIFDEDFAEKLYEKARQYLEHRAEVQEKFREAKEKMRNDLRIFNNIIKNKIEK